MAGATEITNTGHSPCHLPTSADHLGSETTQIQYLNLTPSEITECQHLVDDLFGDALTLPLLPFLEISAIHAQEFPRRIRSAFYQFKLHERFSAFCIRGFTLNDASLGPTPSKHRPPGETERVQKSEAIHILFSSLLGEPFAWTTIQDGYVVNDVMPVLEHGGLISSSGYARSFDLHTEDAFHSCAGEYLGLMCLRNPGRVATLLSTVGAQDLSDHTLRTLAEARYVVGANIAQAVPTVTHYSPILFGNMAWPYIRVNLNNTKAQPDDREAELALEELRAALKTNSVPVVFESGDCWYIDNLRTAHARVPFQPKFDGTDRWLKRIYISGSFRRSASLRNDPASRVLNPLAETDTL